MRKVKLKELIDALPEEVDVDALVERLYLLRKLEAAEQELKEGRGLGHDEVRQRLSQWLE